MSKKFVPSSPGLSSLKQMLKEPLNPLSEYELQLFTNPFLVLGKKRRKTELNN